MTAGLPGWPEVTTGDNATAVTSHPTNHRALNTAAIVPREAKSVDDGRCPTLGLAFGPLTRQCYHAALSAGRHEESGQFLRGPFSRTVR